MPYFLRRYRGHQIALAHRERVFRYGQRPPVTLGERNGLRIDIGCNACDRAFALMDQRQRDASGSTAHLEHAGMGRGGSLPLSDGRNVLARLVRGDRVSRFRRPSARFGFGQRPL